MVKRQGVFKRERPESPDFSVKLTQFILTTSSYRELLRESAALIEKYTHESRIQLAVNLAKQVETISYMVGIDRFDAIAEAFGPL